jgi:hypothetical protein
MEDMLPTLEDGERVDEWRLSGVILSDVSCGSGESDEDREGEKAVRRRRRDGDRKLEDRMVML